METLVTIPKDPSLPTSTRTKIQSINYLPNILAFGKVNMDSVCTYK